MAVTNYYTIDGQMLGYKDAGGRKDFLTDVLGSVTGEVDQTGTNRTFNGRYKPYGGMLWSSGSRGSFGWVGTWGYKSTGLKNSSHYVRARHYSQTGGIWTTQDPLWPNEMAYGYADSNPITNLDSSGTKCEPADPCFGGNAKKICAEAVRLNLHISRGGSGDAGGVICCKNIPYACAFQDLPGAGIEPLVFECIIKHENVHIEKKHVTCDPNKKGLDRPNQDSRDEKLNECAGNVREAGCLANTYNTGCAKRYKGNKVAIDRCKLEIRDRLCRTIRGEVVSNCGWDPKSAVIICKGWKP